MASKNDEKKENLKHRLIEAATIRIAHGGLKTLRARDIAADADCALGSLYTAFSNLDELVVWVNAKTLDDLNTRLKLSPWDETNPVDRMIQLAIGYANFATEHKNLWNCLFELRLVDGQEVPEWHLQQHLNLLENISHPVRLLRPDFDHDQVLLQTRLLFAAVHGIVSLSLEDRFVAIPTHELEQQLTGFVTNIANGIRNS